MKTSIIIAILSLFFYFYLSSNRNCFRK